MPLPFEALIFDHDGTLVDSEPVHYGCWSQVLEAYGANFSFSDYVQHLNGVPSIASAGWIVQHCQLAVAPEVLLQHKQAALKAFLAENAFPLMAGAQAFIEQAYRAGYPLAVASGANRHEIDHSLSSHQLTPYFKTTVTQNDVSRNKPHPDIYLLAAQRLGVAPQQALAIEDSDSGQAAALAAGMTCWRISQQPLPDHPKLRVFPSLQAIYQQLFP